MMEGRVPAILLTLADPPRATELTVALNAAGELSASSLIIAPALSVPSRGVLAATARQALCFLTLHDVCGNSGAAEVFVPSGVADDSPNDIEDLCRRNAPATVFVSLLDFAWAAAASVANRDAVGHLAAALVNSGARVIDISPPAESPLELPEPWLGSGRPTPLHTTLEARSDAHVLRVYASDTAESCAARIAASASTTAAEGTAAAAADAGLGLLVGRSTLQCLQRYGMYGLAPPPSAGPTPGPPEAVLQARSRFCWWRAIAADPPRLPPAPVEALLPGCGSADPPGALPPEAGLHADWAAESPAARPYRVAILGGSFNPVTLAHTQAGAGAGAAGWSRARVLTRAGV